ncbi:MAG: transcriptional repressor [Mariprofundales bacterium]|nr:transcriptional repressor [Mariprofundales bacterium]
MRLTQQRATLLHLINSSDHHWDAEQITKSLSSSGHKIGIATIYRGLQALEQAGLITAIHLDGRKHYERANKEHHDHLICSRCGAIEEFCCPKIESLQQKIAEEHRFTIHDHRLTLYGLCQSCCSR